MEKKSEMIIDRIEAGIVIDHMAPGRSLIVLDILNLTRQDFLKSDRIIATAMNVRSVIRKKKDVLKVSNFSLSQGTIDKLGLIIPNATLSIIKNFQVIEKKKFSLPTETSGFKCPSTTCITNLRENVLRKFLVINDNSEAEQIELRCKFCEEVFPISQFIESSKIDWS